MATDKRLTESQEKFVQNLLKGMSQREAYRDAYPNCKATDKTVDENASRLLNGNPKVLARYDELAGKVKEIAEEEFSVEVKDIIKELATIGFAKQIGIEIKTNDKLKALELLGRHLKMFTDKHVVEVPNGVELTIADKRKVIQERLNELRSND